MKLSAYVERVLRDKVKLSFSIFLLLIPMIDIAQMVYELYYVQGQGWEVRPPDPRYAAFSALYTVGTNHMMHKIMFWFLPIYLLIITGEDSLEDYDTGYNNILKSRMSRKQYVWGKARNSFCFSFLLIFLSLMLNYGLLQVIFDHGGYIKQNPDIIALDREDSVYLLGYYHPIIATIANIFMTAVLSGLLGMIGSGLAMNFHDRKIVYGITFILWFIFVLIDDGLMSILHPFTTMTLDRYVMGFLLIAGGYLLIAMMALIAEVRSDEV